MAFGLIGKVRELLTATGASGNDLSVPGTLSVTGVLSTTAAAAINVASPTIVVNAESTNTIAVDYTSTDAAVEHYRAQVIDSTGLKVAAAFTIAETGDGAEVDGSGTPELIFTTDASGVAQITVTDVAGASGKTCYLIVEMVCTSAETREFVPSSYITMTFD